MFSPKLSLQPGVSVRLICDAAITGGPYLARLAGGPPFTFAIASENVLTWMLRRCDKEVTWCARQHLGCMCTGPSVIHCCKRRAFTCAVHGMRCREVHSAILWYVSSNTLFSSLRKADSAVSILNRRTVRHTPSTLPQKLPSLPARRMLCLGTSFSLHIG